MQADAFPSGPSVWGCHVGGLGGGACEAPECRCAAVAEQSSVSMGKYRGEPAAVAGESLVADGIDTVVNGMQATGLQPAIDRS